MPNGRWPMEPLKCCHDDSSSAAGCGGSARRLRWPRGAVPTDPELAAILELVNEARSQGATCGGEAVPSAPPLAHDPVLGRTAQKHSEDMARAGVMSHVTPTGAIHYPVGTTFDARIRLEGYSFTRAAENIAAGFGSAESVVSAWLASSGHCRNIMNAGYQEIGLGRDGGYWTQVFAAPLEP